MSDLLEFTENALMEIKKIQSDEDGAEALLLRVMVTSGEVGLMNYRLGFDPKPAASEDQTFDVDGIKVVVDGRSGLFLKGTQIDFVDSDAGRGFIFNNPNAKKS